MINYAIFPDDSANQKVPEDFPGTIGLVSDEKGKIILNPDYRSDNEEFDYFISQMLSAINPTFNKFSYRKNRELISEIYSVSHEAFGMLVIYNEHHVWKEQEVMKQNGRMGTMIKKKALLFGKEREQTGMDGCWIEPIQFPVSSSRSNSQKDSECREANSTVVYK